MPFLNERGIDPSELKIGLGQVLPVTLTRLEQIKNAFSWIGADCDLIEWDWPRFRSYFDA